MAAIVLYFQVHQPWRLRRCTAFDRRGEYFDLAQNRAIIRKVANRCYRPATALLLDLARRHGGDFRVSLSLSGTVVEQLREHAPECLDLFQQLAGSGCCEFLGETCCHSLASIFWPEEFAAQVQRHSALLRDTFGQQPRVFRNTELIYSDSIAAMIAGLPTPDGGRFLGMLAEGADHLLAQRSPNIAYRAAGCGLPLLLRNYRLSDDIAFRFSDRAWDQWPLTAAKFVRWVEALDGPICNLFMDYETFGEHHDAATGILDFLEDLPAAALARGCRFLTPSEAVAQHPPQAVLHCPQPTSWADTERDLSAWLGNPMQTPAAEALYHLGRQLPQGPDLEIWRRLTTSDHLYYMSTKRLSDGDVHKYFTPYESPYEAFINFMNVLEHLACRVGADLRGGPPASGGDPQQIPHAV